MKIKDYLAPIIALLLLITSLQLHAGVLSYHSNAHTIRFSDNKSHTLLQSKPFTPREVFSSFSENNGSVVILFNAECNVDAQKAGVWVAATLQERTQEKIGDTDVWGEWTEWRNTADFISNDNEALCSSHGKDAPIVRVSAAVHHHSDFNFSHDFIRYQMRIQGQLREGTGTASIDDTSLILLH